VDPNVTLTPAAQPVSTAAPPVSCKETKTNYAVLVHGYCQPGPWSVWRDAIDQGIFKLAWEYQDFGGNWDGAYLSVFDFANNLRRALESAELGACSIIAHSQGGMASLYMHHHFKTCLDMHEEHMPGSRLIQTVGTPYKGSPLMRSEFLVTLAQVFLGTCGYVRDLDPTHQSGELSWHQNISVESESDVHYFTTRGTAGKPCASDTTRWLFASGLLFSRYAENDGVTANHLAGLDSGHAMGTTSGQCHSENAEGVHRYGHMPQYMDMARNLEMYTARRKAVGSRACDESESDHIIFNVDTGNPVDDGSICSGFYQCKSGYCDKATKKCGARVDIGHDCKSHQHCKSRTCQCGKCQTAWHAGNEFCKTGAPCSKDWECASGTCYNDVCIDKIKDGGQCVALA